MGSGEGHGLSIDGYTCITVPRPESMRIRGRAKRGHGGICLFVRNTVSPDVEVSDKNPALFFFFFFFLKVICLFVFVIFRLKTQCTLKMLILTCLTFLRQTFAITQILALVGWLC